jgi:hypothetical protein
MKKILFILAMCLVFCVNVSAQENRYGLTTAEVEFLKSAMDNNSVPYTSYVASWYVYSENMKDYVKLDRKPTDVEAQYYKYLNKVYTEYSRNKKHFRNPDDFFNNEVAYLNAKSHRYKNELIAGVTLTAVGVATIVISDLYILNRDWTTFEGKAYELEDHIHRVENISRLVGGALTITGAVLTIDAINKQHHLLKVSTNKIAYTLKF